MVKLVKLTAPSGKPVWVAPHWVESVSEATATRYYVNVKTIIRLSGSEQGVTETPYEVVAALEEGE